MGLTLIVNPKRKKTVSIPKDLNVNDIDLNTATQLLSLPKVIGEHSETRKEIKIGLGRFGYYIFYNGSRYFSLKKSSKKVLNIELREVVQIIANSQRKELKSLGVNKKGKEIFICKRYGFYIKCYRTNVALGTNADIGSIDLKKALELIKNKK